MDNNSVAIEVRNIGKVFKIPHEKSNSLKAAALNGFKHKGYTKYTAARDISFTVNTGEFLGIIGRNGCGKSTMLKMLAGIYIPDRGYININSSLSPFLELGVGFNPELSAKDNIYLNGTILGMTRKQIDEVFDKILDFSELREFVDMKLKNFSSGMQVRLAFSVAINAHADILLIDEVLAVGDVNFQKKCFETFRDFKRQGKTIVFVSHGMDSIRSFCDRVIVLDDGNKVFDGDTEKAIDIYTKLNNSRSLESEGDLKSLISEDLGNKKAKIENYVFLNKDGKITKYLKAGEKFSLQMKVIFTENVANPSFGLMFRKNTHEDLFGINSIHRPKPLRFGLVEKGKAVTVKFSAKMPLNPGVYLISLAVSDQEHPESYELLHLLNNFDKIEVFGDCIGWGLVSSDSKVDVVI